MIQIAFCDDDTSALNQVRVLLDQYRVLHDLELTFTAFQHPFELLEAIEKGTRFDILFLDVMMPGVNGIGAAKEIREYDSNVKIIFLTSSSEFAVQSYTVGAYFYQLKPIWAESFYRLMDAVTAACKKEQEFSLILRCKSGITRVDLQELEYCEVIGRTLLFHLNGGAVLESSGSLDELCSQLAQYDNFLRPHRSFLVNMAFIRSISSRAIIMNSFFEVPIPHGKYSEVKNAYLEYAFRRRQLFIQ